MYLEDRFTGRFKGVSAGWTCAGPVLRGVVKCLCGVLIWMAAAATCRAEVVESIIAVVDGKPILLSELDRAMIPYRTSLAKKYSGDKLASALRQSLNAALRELIDEQLLIDEAERESLTVSDESIEQAVAAAKSKFATDDAFKKSLAARGMTEEELRANIRRSQLLSQLMALKRREYRDKVTVSEQEIDERLSSIPLGPAESPQIELWQIWIAAPRDEDKKARDAARARCEDILRKIRAGADFEQMARTSSEGPERDKGGLLGLVKKGEMQPELDKKAFTMEPGEVSDVIESDTGFHILRVTKVIPPDPKQVATRRRKAEDIILGEKMQAMFDVWMTGLRAKADIDLR